MNFERRLSEGKAKKVKPSTIRASSIFNSARQAISTAEIIFIIFLKPEPVGF